MVGFIYFTLAAKFVDFSVQHFHFLSERTAELLEEGVHLFLALVGLPPLEDEGRYFLGEMLRGRFEFLVLVVEVGDVEQQLIVVVSGLEDEFVGVSRVGEGVSDVVEFALCLHL